MQEQPIENLTKVARFTRLYGKDTFCTRCFTIYKSKYVKKVNGNYLWCPKCFPDGIDELIDANVESLLAGLDGTIVHYPDEETK